MRRAAAALALAAAALAATQEAPAQTDRPDAGAVVAETDAGLALLRRGDAAAAFDKLNTVNEIVQANAYGPLATFYPNMGLAFYFLDRDENAAALQFASSAVAGFNTHGMGDHPGRLMASVAQGAALERLGRREEAELTLRSSVAETRQRPGLSAVHGLALYHLARVATLLDSNDQREIRRDFLDRFSSDWPVPLPDAIHIQYYDLEHAERSGAALEDLIRRSEALLRLATPIEGLPRAQLLYYHGYHGMLLARAQRFRDARPFLIRQYRYMREARINGPDVWRNLRQLALVLYRTDGPKAAYDLLHGDLAYARSLNAPPQEVATLLRDMGHILRNGGEDLAAQEQYRAAYAEARRALPVTDTLSRELRLLIDPRAPGFDDFAFAEEVRSIGSGQIALLPDASGTLQAFVSQGFAGVRPRFAGVDPAAMSDPATFLINRALYHSLVGLPDAMRADLEAAHAAASRNRSALSPEAPIFDIIHAIGFLWGTEHAPGRALASLEALHARYAGLSEGERLIFHALGAYAGSQLNKSDLMKREILAWTRQPRAGTPQTSWDIFANLLALELAFGNLPAAQTDALHAALQKAMGPPPGYQLARALSDMAWLVLASPDSRSDEALAARALVEQALAESLPDDHNILSAARFTLANAYLNRGEAAQSAVWMRKAVTTLRASKYHRPDRLAYLMARHSRSLRALGDLNGGAALAADALAMIDAETASGTYLGEVLIAQGTAIWDRTRNPAKAAAFFDDWLNRPGVLERLQPETRVELLILDAGARARTGDVQTALDAFARARDAMRLEHWDWRFKRARLELDQARLHYRAGHWVEAFADVTLANDLYVDWAADNAVTAVADPETYKTRATWEAAIGWSLAQSLDP